MVGVVDHCVSAERRVLSLRSTRGTAYRVAILRSPTRRQTSAPVRKPYSSEFIGCVSSSTTEWQPEEKIRSRRLDGPRRESEKNKSTTGRFLATTQSTILH